MQNIRCCFRHGRASTERQWRGFQAPARRTAGKMGRSSAFVAGKGREGEQESAAVDQGR